MTSFFDHLSAILAQDERLVGSDNRLLRNKIVELASRLDENLLTLLLGDETTKARFFKEVAGFTVFDKVEFSWVVNNRQFLPDSYTRYRNKIGLVDSTGNRLVDSGEVSLVWPYKDCVLEGGMSENEAKRDEVFWNEMLAREEIDRLLKPKAIQKAVRYTEDGNSEQPQFGLDENLIVRGNNLVALASLLPKYRGKVDMVYIDPPYNPRTKSNTFPYNNRFNRSTWLTFMLNRLRLAKELLTDDGVLVVAIDKNEDVYLGVLLDELFPKPRYVIEKITIVHNPRGVQGDNFSYTHEYAYFVMPAEIPAITSRSLGDIDWTPFRNWGGESLRSDGRNTFYPVRVKDGEVVGFGDVLPENVSPAGKNEQVGEEIWVYPIDRRGIERKWRYARNSVESMPHQLRAVEGGDGVLDIELGKSTGAYKTVWVDERYDANANGTQLLNRLVPNNDFGFPKSLYNVKDCVHAVTADKKDALVLDFFAGSGTTAHAVMDLNKDDGGQRRFILIEQMDYIETVTVPRVKKVIEENGLGAFTYIELAKLNELFIELVMAATTEEALEATWSDIRDAAYFSYRVDPGDVSPGATDFSELDFESKRRLIIESLEKNMLYVNADEVRDGDFELDASVVTLTENFYGGGTE